MKWRHLAQFSGTQKSRMLPRAIVMSDDVSGGRDQSQINPLFEVRTNPVGRREREILDDEGGGNIWKPSNQLRPIDANRNRSTEGRH